MSTGPISSHTSPLGACLQRVTRDAALAEDVVAQRCRLRADLIGILKNAMLNLCTRIEIICQRAKCGAISGDAGQIVLLNLLRVRPVT